MLNTMNWFAPSLQRQHIDANQTNYIAINTMNDHSRQNGLSDTHNDHVEKKNATAKTSSAKCRSYWVPHPYSAKTPTHIQTKLNVYIF